MGNLKCGQVVLLLEFTNS